MTLSSLLRMVLSATAFLVVLGGNDGTQDSQEDPRAFTGESDWKERSRKPEWGDDAPGRDVLGLKLLPIREVPYSSPEKMKYPVADDDLVIGLVVGEFARAYPIKMLGGPQREIVNERLDGRTFAVNW